MHIRATSGPRPPGAGELRESNFRELACVGARATRARAQVILDFAQCMMLLDRACIDYRIAGSPSRNRYAPSAGASTGVYCVRAVTRGT